MKKRLLLLPVMAIVLALMFVMTACSDSDSKKKDKDDEDSTPKYERPVESYFKAIETGSGKEFRKCYCDAEIEYRNQIVGSGEDYFDNGAEELNRAAISKFGDDVRITYKVDKKDKFEDDDLEKYTDKLTRRCGGEKEIKITEGYKLKLKVKIKGSKGEDEDSMTIKVGKTDGRWILLEM